MLELEPRHDRLVERKLRLESLLPCTVSCSDYGVAQLIGDNVATHQLKLTDVVTPAPGVFLLNLQSIVELLCTVDEGIECAQETWRLQERHLPSIYFLATIDQLVNIEPQEVSHLVFRN